ncbi:RASD family member 3 [Pangasianodon hypophthalmus]|uniref:RASD family member 3 n=1 Tax=Pangasianodon hypophthalmus TaxID=310915 RepID=UPI000EFEF7D4|nr:RASD family member 3 [Pangasianodon hypophthalmus]
MTSSSLSVPERRTARIVFLGAAGVGKTALIARFLHDRFEPRHARTVEELHALECDLDGAARLRLEILDTSGSYAFPAMRALRIRTGDAFALVYAARDRGSLEEARRLRDEILEIKGDAFDAITVVESKADLASRSRAESARTMRAVEEEWRAGFVSASARTGENVAAVFRELLARADLPSRVSPALRRRRQTCGRDCGDEKANMRKNSSCVLS